MSSEDKRIIKSIIEAVSILPEEKREYILGYAEGVIAMSNCTKATAPPGA